MRVLLQLTALAILLCGAACSRSDAPHQSVTWQSQCSVDGITLSSPEDMRIMRALAHECAPVGACTLACLRSGCDNGISRNCFHACSPAASGTALASVALQFANGSHAMCGPGPNNSFKPNALRYTNNMAKQLAMLLAPLRTSA
jgi:hypothetical protein